MKHAIRLHRNSDENSHWLEIGQSDSYSVSVSPLESDSKEELVDAILAEFVNTPNELKPILKDKLRNWLDEMNDSALELMNTEKVRDFIYEMF